MNHTLSVADFSAYPPQARRFASDHIATLQGLPPVFCALLLKEISQFDWQFPAERSDLAAQLSWIETADRERVTRVLTPFASLQASNDVMEIPWAAQPVAFLERLTADLWLTHSIDAFYSAGKKYGEVLETIRNDAEASRSRLCIVFIGADSPRTQQPLFEKLRTHGTYFTQVNLSDGVAPALAAIEKEALAHPAPFQNWYIDGGAVALDIAKNWHPASSIQTLSYASLEPVRQNVIQAMNEVCTTAGSGPERLRSVLAQMHPVDHETGRTEDNEVMQEFVLRLFTEGSGTQVFSTTFVQWAGREVLRRARPQSLFLRFRLRQAERPMDELLGAHRTNIAYDERGSLIDGDMGAFYTWINLQRLPGAQKSRFIACFENGHEAVAIAPGLPAGSTSDSPCSLRDLLTWTA